MNISFLFKQITSILSPAFQCRLKVDISNRFEHIVDRNNEDKWQNDLEWRNDHWSNSFHRTSREMKMTKSIDQSSSFWRNVQQKWERRGEERKMSWSVKTISQMNETKFSPGLQLIISEEKFSFVFIFDRCYWDNINTKGRERNFLLKFLHFLIEICCMKSQIFPINSFCSLFTSWNFCWWWIRAEISVSNNRLTD